ATSDKDWMGGVEPPRVFVRLCRWVRVWFIRAHGLQSVGLCQKNPYKSPKRMLSALPLSYPGIGPGGRTRTGDHYLMRVCTLTPLGTGWIPGKPTECTPWACPLCSAEDGL